MFVEAHVEACGANDHVGGLDGAAVGRFKEEAFEDASDLALASLEKAGIVSAAIDGGAIGKVVVACNLVGAAPADGNRLRWRRGLDGNSCCSGEAGGEVPEGKGQLRSSGRRLFSF